MSKLNPTPKTGFILFISLTVVLFGQAVWWIAFMATLINEKVEMATDLGADKKFIEMVQSQEISRQIMIGMEGVFFLSLVLAGAWLIYRALRKTEELKFHQQNFLMAVTHELKTPIASMKIYIDSLQSPKITDEKKSEIFPKVKKDIIRLEKLVENILDAGRFDRSGYHLDKDNFDLSKMLNRAVDKIEALPSKIPVNINRLIEPSFQIFGDEKALQRAIDSILENSLNYNDKNDIKVEISLSIKNNKIEISIKDNGIGLIKKDKTEIFNRFYRVGEEIRRSGPGTGLGLYLSREIINAHDGTIKADSDGIGKGSIFTIILKNNKKWQ